MTDIKDGANYAPSAKAEKVVADNTFNVAAAFLDHGHIYGQCNGLRDAGATIKYVYEPNRKRCQKFIEAYPGVTAVDSFEKILGAADIQLVVSAAIPNQRADIGIRVMQAGKDYFVDKSPFTTRQQLEDVKRCTLATKRKYAVYYAERLHNDAAWHAGELITNGAIGRVLHVTCLAPHRLAKTTRPDWFFEKSCYGGILTDIGSHQVEQFLTYADCKDATINFARAKNLGHPDKKGFEDFGEMSLVGDNGSSFYSRVDWYTPEGLRTWGDGRTFILGTQGGIELRKYIDIASEAPCSNLYLVDNDREQKTECKDKTGFPFFGQLILDCIHGTEKAMSQAHCFKAAELSLRAQEYADYENMRESS